MSHTLHLYYHNYSPSIAPTPCPLTPYEHKRMINMDPDQASAYAHSRYLIRYLLSLHQIEPHQLDYSPRGKPKLNSTPFTISLSHSKNLWICGITQAKHLGIDTLDRSPHNPQLLAKKCSLPSTSSLEDIKKAWMLKEAYAKCFDVPLMSVIPLKIDTLMRKSHCHFGYLTTPIPIAWVADRMLHVRTTNLQQS